MRPSRFPNRLIHTHTPSYPWVIWIEAVRDRALVVTVFSPKPSRFRAKPLAQIQYAAGPIYYSSDREQAERITELIEAGIGTIPTSSQYRVALSLEDVREILAESWGIPLPSSL